MDARASSLVGPAMASVLLAGTLAEVTLAAPSAGSASTAMAVSASVVRSCAIVTDHALTISCARVPGATVRVDVSVGSLPSNGPRATAVFRPVADRPVTPGDSARNPERTLVVFINF